MIKLNDDLIWKGTGKKWHVSDMSFTGNDIISSEDGNIVCEVANEKDCSLIKKAPELLLTLYKLVALHCSALDELVLDKEQYDSVTRRNIEMALALNLIKEICYESDKNKNN